MAEGGDGDLGAADIGADRLDRDALLGLLEQMLLIRRFEEKAGQLYGMGRIGGFCHLYIGQEAVATGVQAALEPGKDSVITAYRDHGHMLVAGMNPKRVMAELTGRAAGYSKGKGGSMHMFAADRGFYGGHGIVGAQVPIGAGLAFAHKYRNDGGVAVTYLGDGALNQGQVYEAFNMASLWDLPVLFVIENNRYGMGTSVERHAAARELWSRGESFGIGGEKVDGMDVEAVYDVASRLIDDVRATSRPVLLEAATYRYRGHSMSDPAKYRTKDEVETVKQTKDPIETAKARLMERHGVAEAALKELDKKARAIVNEAAGFAQEAPEPPLDDLLRDILAVEPAQQ